MIALRLDEIADLCPGRLERAAWADEVTGVQIDSRRVAEGDLFVAVGGGGDFAKHAFARGAAAVLLPEDAFASLGALGGAVRARSSAQVVGITGSTGKTSTRDILAAIVGPHARTIAAERNFNNELGVPLTLCRLEPDTEVCIVELGMRGFGQIRALCEVARPTIGVITNIAPVHLELLGSLEGVARAKAELLAELPAGASAVVPSEAPELEPFLQRADLHYTRFGTGGDVRLCSFERLNGNAKVEVEIFGERLELTFAFGARYQARNALAALGAYRALRLPLAGASAGASALRLTSWRGEELPLPGGGVLLNDCYNANPLSMQAALGDLAERAAGRRRVAVLGEMAELGPEAPEFHRAVGRAAVEAGVGLLVAVGGEARAYVEAAAEISTTRFAASAAEAIPLVEELVRPGDAVLVKGSRSVGLEVVADALARTAVTA